MTPSLIEAISSSTSSSRKDTLSVIFDEKFDEAFDLTAKEKDLYHVKWGRIDYFNVTRITTKWNVWRYVSLLYSTDLVNFNILRGPMLVVLSDRGQTLRFLNARQLRPEPTLMRRWLEDGGYLQLHPWKSIYGPGGDR
jgi:hypothetical protein